MLYTPFPRFIRRHPAIVGAIHPLPVAGFKFIVTDWTLSSYNHWYMSFPTVHIRGSKTLSAPPPKTSAGNGYRRTFSIQAAAVRPKFLPLRIPALPADHATACVRQKQAGRISSKKSAGDRLGRNGPGKMGMFVFSASAVQIHKLTLGGLHSLGLVMAE